MASNSSAAAVDETHTTRAVSVTETKLPTSETSPQTMKAIVQDEYGTADVLKFEDVERPTIKEDEVLLRVKAAGVDMGAWHLMTGLPYIGRLAFGLRRPSLRIRGLDVSGVVEAVGAKVTRFQAGDEVFGVCNSGSFAEFASAKEAVLVHKPKEITFEQAAATPISAVTALNAVRDTAQVKSGDCVAVIGAAGGVGSFAVQLAKADGAEVTGICSTGKLELVKSIGADHVIDYTKEDFTEKGPVFDVIIDTAGNRPLSLLRKALKPAGTLVIVGGEGAGNVFGMSRQLGALLLSRFTTQRLCPILSLIQGHAELDTLKELLEAGKVKPLMDRVLPLKDAPDAIRHIEKGHAAGKVVLTV